MGFNQLGTGSKWTKNTFPVSLPSGTGYVLPSGQYLIDLGPYSCVQYWDNITQIWRDAPGPFNIGNAIISADGSSIRIFNPTGSAVGGYVTNGGSGYTNGIYNASSAPITLSAGTASLNCIVGGSINTSLTTVAGGVGYNNPPTVLFSQPPTGGVMAAANATVSGGAVTVVVTNQGAGYGSAPSVTIVPNPIDVAAGTITTVASFTAALTNSGRVTALTLGPNGGNGYTATPTISSFNTGVIGGGTSAAATIVMCYTVTGISSASGGSANQTAALATVYSTPLSASKTNAPINPYTEQGLFNVRFSQAVATLSSGVATAFTMVDGGLHQSTTSPTIVTESAWATAAPTASVTGTLAFGGVVDTTLITAL